MGQSVGEDNDGAVFGSMGQVTSVTLWEFCRWTYRRQRAHVHLKTTMQAATWAYSASVFADADTPRPTVHWDAAMLHAEVVGLGEPMADAIIWAAEMGERPELPDAAPQPYPVEIDGMRRRRFNPAADEAQTVAPLEVAPSKQHPALERPARGTWRGKRVEILVKTAGFEVGWKPVYRRTTRRKLVQSGQEPYWYPVEYCPLRWEPDPGWYAAAVHAYAAWREAMLALDAALRDAEFREHALVAEEIPPAPHITTLEYNVAADLANPFAPVEVDLAKPPRGQLVAHLFEDGPLLAERRLSATVRA